MGPRSFLDDYDMELVRVARNAMATRFEVALHGEDPVSLRAAAEEALDEIEQLESRLSLFLPSSDISRVNARAAVEPVRVGAQVFRLLSMAKDLHRETSGTFDVTIGPLMRCWGLMGGKGTLPDTESIEAARAKVGMQHVILREDDFTVQFERPGMMIDLGGIGKGFGMEYAVEVLLEAGVTSALLHGGTSTIYALGTPPEADAWDVAIEAPEAEDEGTEEVIVSGEDSAPEPESVLAVVSLKDEAMSVSGIHGKSFSVDGKVYGHVLDPRIGRPVQGASLSAVVLKSATLTDALSTALLTLGFSDYSRVVSNRPEMRFLLGGAESGNEKRFETRGIELAGKACG